MRNTRYRPAKPAGTEQAIEITGTFLKAIRGQHETDTDAIRDLARRSSISFSTVRSFVQPSRRPKDVSLTVWQRLRGAYLRYLRQQLDALELEIVRVEALDPADRALVDLLDKAEAVARRIRAAMAPAEPDA